MELKGIKIGFALTGSFCTFKKVLPKMKELIKNNYDTIVISNEVAGFSEDIIKKYQKSKNIKIVISLDKE